MAESVKVEKEKDLTEIVLASAREIAREAKVKAIFLYLDALPVAPPLTRLSSEADLYLITSNKEAVKKAKGLAKKVLLAPPVALTRMGQVKLGVLMALSMNLLVPGDKILCLSGLPELESLDTISVLEIGKEFELLSSMDHAAITESTSPEVFQAVLNLALELANQGREGKPVGTILVVGDQEKVYQYSRQMIINPFKGYPPAERNILEGKLKETIKEFSTLDGAFVISGDGTVMSAGRHLNAAYEGEELPHGFGARHAAAAAITGVTKAVSIAISESSGTVTIFKDGKVLMEIEKP